MLPAREAALLIALLLKRSEQRRARISEKTLKRISQRTRLRSAFVQDVADELADLEILLVELNRGGYGILPASAMESAPAIHARDHILAEVRAARRGELDAEAVLEQIVERPEGEEDDDAPE